MNYQIAEIFELTKLTELMESFYKVSGISSGLVDRKGNILIKTGWQEICTKFHRMESATQAICQESDRTVLSRILQGSDEDPLYLLHKCKNGLYFAVSPIKIRGFHIANFMFGQFFIDPPVREEFVQRAREYSFPEKDYLAALERVPIYDLDKLDSIIHHFRQFAEVLGEMGLNRLELIEAKKREVLQAKNQLRFVFDNLKYVAVQVYNLQGKVLYWNPASQELFGWEAQEALGKTIDRLIFDRKTVQEFLRKLDQLNQGQVVKPQEWICRDREGNEKIVFSTIVPVCMEDHKEFICIDIDTTERKLLEKEIARLDRLNLVGEMAATISHEVRNPMTTVRGFLQVLLEKGECQKYADYYKLMIQELDRANSIITEFLSLARNKPIQREKVQLNQMLEALRPLLEANALMFNQNIEIITKRIPKLRLDEKEIRQLLLNLVRNAMEAMDPGGHLLIKTYCEGNYVILSVSDDGPGIAPSILDKLGTPFLTTKPSGTGLGLPVCYSIALRHNALIEVNTGKNGTTFLVKFARPGSGA